MQPIVDIDESDLNPSPPKKLDQRPTQTPILQSYLENTKQFKRLNNNKVSD